MGTQQIPATSVSGIKHSSAFLACTGLCSNCTFVGVVRVGLPFCACVVDRAAPETKSKVRPKKKFACPGF